MNKLSPSLFLSCLTLFLVAMVLPCRNIYAESGYYTFNMPWDKNLPLDISIDKLMPQNVAGTHGVLQTSGESLKFEDGTPFRGWGVGIRLTDDFPPDSSSDMALVVDRIASLGYNHLRIYGFDYTKPGVYSRWLTNGTLPKEEMSRVCRFIDYAKSKGIYYSISANHNPLRYKGISAELGEKRKRLWDNYKTQQIIDPVLIDETDRWIQVLFSYTGGDCSTSFADDPANIYFDAINEASVFQAYAKNFKHINKASYKLLNDGFRVWLSEKYKSDTALSKSWREDVNLKDIEINGWDKLKGLNTEIRKDTIAYLIKIESDFNSRIISAVKSAGYKGLTSTTNHWYGDGALLASKMSDVIEIHTYFDRPRKGVDADGWLLGLSYIESFTTKPVKRWNYNQSPLHLLFESSLADKPLIVTEWNHGAWSDYAYEGPVLMMAYASYQNYPIVDLHTYQESVSSYKEGYNKSGFSFGGNAVLMALQPSLSIGFLGNYIPSFTKQPVIADFTSYDQALNEAAVAGVRFTKKPTGQTSVNAFEKKHRRELISKSNNYVEKKSVKHQRAGRHNNKEFIVDEAKFKSRVGNLTTMTDWHGFPHLSVNSHGAITVASLDNQDLSASNRILITIVSGYTRADRRSKLDGGFISKKKLIVRKAGESDPMLKLLDATIRLEGRSKGEPPVLFSLAFDGVKTIIPASNVEEKDGVKEFSYTVSSPSPWYIAEY